MVKANKEKSDPKASISDSDNLTQKAYIGLRRMLFMNEISPGHKIHYRDMAEKMQMSPTPIIHALKWLEFQGLVRHERNRGFFLEPVSLDEINEIFDLREQLEVGLLPKVLENLNSNRIEKLRCILQKYKTAAQEDQHKQKTMAAVEFHIALASISNSLITCRMLRTLFDLVYLKYQVDIFLPRPAKDTADYHQKILDFIEAKDLKGARQTLSQDIRTVRKVGIDALIRRTEEKENVIF